jgi:putative ABC transport system substrate-binding protein
MKRREFTILGVATASTMWPPGGHAQRKAMPVIGFLSGGAPREFASYVAAFHRGLGETGYIDGQSVALEHRWAEDRYDRLPALAADLVGRKVDVIVASGGGFASLAAKSATATIPIVFTFGGDPVAAGLVASLARPGSNLTGVSILAVELNPKRLELLRELVPQARAIALLVNPSNANSGPGVRRAEDLVRPNGMQLHVLKASTDREIDAAFAALAAQQAGALFVFADPFIDSRREQVVALAARHAVPAIYPWREYAIAGGLITYGTSRTAAYRQVGTYVGRILKGAKPADLPVVQPTTFELVVNLKTAKALGITIPPTILGRADEVIE